MNSFHYYRNSTQNESYTYHNIKPKTIKLLEKKWEKIFVAWGQAKIV